MLTKYISVTLPGMMSIHALQAIVSVMAGNLYIQVIGLILGQKKKYIVIPNKVILLLKQEVWLQTADS